MLLSSFPWSCSCCWSVLTAAVVPRWFSHLAGRTGAGSGRSGAVMARDDWIYSVQVYQRSFRRRLASSPSVSIPQIQNFSPAALLPLSINTLPATCLHVL